MSPVKGGGGMRINEDGTRTFIEDDDSESDDGHHHPHHRQGSAGSSQQGFHDGWDDDEDWDADPEAEGDEDVTIRQSIDVRSSGEDNRPEGPFGMGRVSEEMEPWAVDARRSVEKAKKPAKGILKGAPVFLSKVVWY
ncbi:hypothetical protein NLJ89_g12386 [Agrocybe chaxingu]|uniref:Uncharacterized protein n=1 Tax=Agrocybe chaxingu TaxID=84603 RepID=A0A9W8MQ96_9AGAR|nr:hypothetical protein NLJ89_g12386 [Agrocybe chaxingu]